ncbi:hypothetical protein BC830DRAFT_31872 [Chytriomyces sp. MP71]|nr:hypothetical protein BC830DRAFT_31872 [Chytriomyces sp. MP71]
MLGFTPTSILESADRFTVTSCESDATPDEDGNVPPVSITCSWIVASASSCAESNGFASVLEKIARVEAGSAKHVSRCICVRDCGMDEVGEPGLFVVPAKDGRNAVVGIQHSGSALVCPDGKCKVVFYVVVTACNPSGCLPDILYLMAQASESGTAEEDLQDALREVLATTPGGSHRLLFFTCRRTIS